LTDLLAAAESFVLGDGACAFGELLSAEQLAANWPGE
jgi:hypothetical protein